MDELPDLPDFRDIHPRPLVGDPPAGGGILKRMSSTPLSSSLASIVRGTATAVVSRVEGASEDEEEEATTPPRRATTTATSYFGAYRSPSSSSPHSHTTTTTTTLIHEKDTPTSEDGPSGGEGLVDHHHHRTRMSTASPPPHSTLRPASAMARQSRPSSPEGGFIPSPVTKGSAGSMVTRARKMPSTPSLRQQHHDHQYMDHHHHQHQLYCHESARARLSQPPPPLLESTASTTTLRGQLHNTSTVSDDFLSDDEDEELEDDENEDEEDEDVDVNHYALSPWATAPASVLADARIRGNRNMGPATARQPNTSAPAATAIASGTALTDDADEDDGKETARSRPRDGVDGGDEGDLQTMALDPERSILQIGELASHHRHGLLTSKRGVGDGDGDGPVEVATHVLDSMMIGGPSHRSHRGRTESSSSSSEVVTMDVDEDMEVEGHGNKGLVGVSPLQRHQEEEDGEGQEKRVEQLVTTTATSGSGLALSQNRNHSLKQQPSLASGVPLTEEQQPHYQLLLGQQQNSGDATMPTKQLSPLPPPSSDHEQHRLQQGATSEECNDDVVM